MASYFTPILPTPDVHPRMVLTPANLVAYGVRTTGTHASYWTNLQTWLNSNVSKDPLSFFAAKDDDEYSIGYALSYTLNPGNTTHRDKALDIATVFSQIWGGTTYATFSHEVQRAQLRVMAYVYDWNYDYVVLRNRKTLLQQAIKKGIDVLTARVIPSEYLYGHSNGEATTLLVLYSALLNDTAFSYDKAALIASFDLLLDKFYKTPTSGDDFFSGYRHFGDVDGGTFKGAGPWSYLRAQHGFYGRAAPILKSAVGIDLYQTEAWLSANTDFDTWHWRGDRSFHRDGDNKGLGQYAPDTHVKMLQIAARNTGNGSRVAQWFAEEFESLSVADSNAYAGLWGPYNVHQVLFRDTTIASLAPTLANMNGGNWMKIFRNTGRVVIRDGWTTGGFSLVIYFPKYFTGGHTHRDAGHYCLATGGKPIFFGAGHYDPNDTTTEPFGNPPQLHRFSYYRRIISKNAIGIYDTDEPSENANEFRSFSSASTQFQGNDGGQRWPKRITGTGTVSDSEPDSMRDLEGAAAWPAWKFSSIVYDIETSSYCYVVGDIADWYYSAKRTRVRRHFLVLKPGVFVNYAYPILMIWDDVVAHVDAVKGTQTCRLYMQSKNPPIGSGGDRSYADGGGASDPKVYHRIVQPAVTSQTQGGYDTTGDNGDFILEGQDMAPALGAREKYDDSKSDNSPGGGAGLNWRTEIFPVAYTGTFSCVEVFYPTTNGAATPTAETAIDTATHVGATIDSVDIRIAKGDQYGVIIGAVADTIPPVAPTGLVAVAGDSKVDLSWDKNMESDMLKYKIERKTL